MELPWEIWNKVVDVVRKCDFETLTLVCWGLRDLVRRNVLLELERPGYEMRFMRSCNFVGLSLLPVISRRIVCKAAIDLDLMDVQTRLITTSNMKRDMDIYAQLTGKKPKSFFEKKIVFASMWMFEQAVRFDTDPNLVKNSVIAQIYAIKYFPERPLNFSIGVIMEVIGDHVVPDRYLLIVQLLYNLIDAKKEAEVTQLIQLAPEYGEWRALHRKCRHLLPEIFKNFEVVRSKNPNVSEVLDLISKISYVFNIGVITRGDIMMSQTVVFSVKSTKNSFMLTRPNKPDMIVYDKYTLFSYLIREDMWKLTYSINTGKM
jgi:hypothetical protein